MQVGGGAKVKCPRVVTAEKKKEKETKGEESSRKWVINECPLWVEECADLEEWVNVRRQER